MDTMMMNKPFFKSIDGGGVVERNTMGRKGKSLSKKVSVLVKTMPFHFRGGNGPV